MSTDTSTLLAEFPEIGKAEWLEKIARDLKEKPIDALYWELPDGIRADPFGHADDFEHLPEPLHLPPGWEIGEDIPTSDIAAGNALALLALEGGAEGLCFQLQGIKADSLEGLLQNIHLDYIGLHFQSDDWTLLTPAALLDAVGKIAQSRGIGLEKLSGSIAWNPAAGNHTPDWRYAAEWIGQAGIPGFRLLTVEAPVQDSLVDDLVELLRRGQQCISALAEQGVAPASTAATLQFEWLIGDQYFVEIAKLRAFRQLWYNVLNAWEAPLSHPYLNARFRHTTYTDDLYTNMIRATTMAMSGVLGGVNRLTILPYDAGREAQAVYPGSFSRRIARNVQHLLKMESGLDAIAEPAAGSYYIEKLTQQLAAAAWRKFQQTTA